MRKEPTQILSCNLFSEGFDFLNWILKIYSATLLVSYSVFMYRYFLICSKTLKESFLESTGAFWLLLKRKNVKQTFISFVITFKEMLRKGVFYSAVKYLHWKCCPDYARTGWKMSWLYDVITKLWRNDYSLLILFVVSTCLLSPSNPSINKP